MPHDQTERAHAILQDHVAGLHADHDDPDVGCRYRGCDDAYWLLAFSAGPGVHEITKLLDSPPHLTIELP